MFIYFEVKIKLECNYSDILNLSTYFRLFCDKMHVLMAFYDSNAFRYRTLGP